MNKKLATTLVLVIFGLISFIARVASAGPVDNWHLRSPYTLNATAYGGGTFVAVGEGGRILLSTKGIQWKMSQSGSSGWLRGVAYGNHIFVAVGDNGVILTSKDGQTWEKEKSGVTSSLDGVTWGDKDFVAVGNNGVVLTSPD